MSKFTSLVLGTLCFSSMASAEMSFKPRPIPTPPPMATSNHVLFTATNHVNLNDEISGPAVSKAMVSLATIKAANPVLFISSPGGSIDAGMRLVDMILGSPREITCVAQSAASMAFVIFQACHKRYVLNDTTLMQHQARFGVKGFEENFKTFSSYIFSMLDKINKAQADRMGISIEKFNEMRKHDLWLYGADAVSAKAADSVVSASCTEDLLLSTKDITFMTIFGEIGLKYSACPLMVDPIAIDFKGVYDENKRVQIYEKFMKGTREPIPFTRERTDTPFTAPTSPVLR